MECKLNLLNTRDLNFDNVKSVIFTKLESSTSQKQAHVMFKRDMGSNGNLMPFKVFKIPFPKSTLHALHTTKSSSVMLKTYNQLDIKQ